LSEKCNAFLRPLKKKGLKEKRVTTMRLDDLGTSTTLESNKSLLRWPRDMANTCGDVVGALI
jgi:hypothetical protein